MGATEVQGHHLPMGSDNIHAEYLSEILARKHNGIVTPVIPVGNSRILDAFPGLSVTTETLKIYAREVLESLLRYNIKKVFVMQGHLGNVTVIADLLYELKREYSDVKFCQMDLWRFVKSNSFDVVEDQYSAKYGHAGEACTSVMMAIDKNLVGEFTDNANHMCVDLYKLDINTLPELNEIAPHGTIGNPIKASEEKGKILINRLLDRVAKHLEE